MEEEEEEDQVFKFVWGPLISQRQTVLSLYEKAGRGRTGGGPLLVDNHFHSRKKLTTSWLNPDNIKEYHFDAGEEKNNNIL